MYTQIYNIILYSFITYASINRLSNLISDTVSGKDHRLRNIWKFKHLAELYFNISTDKLLNSRSTVQNYATVDFLQTITGK